MTVDRADIEPIGFVLPDNLMDALDASLRRVVDF
jgi:hypothetical protein